MKGENMEENIYVVYHSEYDDHDILIVTTNLIEAIKKFKNSHYIEFTYLTVWKNGNEIDNYNSENINILEEKYKTILKHIFGRITERKEYGSINL